jgi:hypothetical protein
MADPPKIKIRQVVVCDDIRREINGKEILIGVYNAGIVVPNFPTAMALSFWIQFTSDSPADNLPLDIRLMGDGDLQFIHLQAGIKVDRVGLGSIGIGPLPVMLQVPTNLRLQIKQSGSDWETVEEIKADKGPVSTLATFMAQQAPVSSRTRERT